jgi:uncharacterized Zn-binding protein involved in type VI secretion
VSVVIPPAPPGMPAAKQGDKVVAVDTHILMIPSPGGPVPTPTPLPFVGTLSGSLSQKVIVEDQAAATVGSTGMNTPAHVPAGGPFQKPPSNQATVQVGSSKVLIEDKAAARHGDPALTCNDPADLPNGKIIAVSKVLIGG